MFDINSRGPSYSLNRSSANSTNDTGDFTFGQSSNLETKLNVVSRLPLWCGITELKPGNRHGFESDQRVQPDFAAEFGQDGRFNTFGNLGIAILTAPTELFSQNDVFTYGAAGIFQSTNNSA